MTLAMTATLEAPAAEALSLTERAAARLPEQPLIEPLSADQADADEIVSPARRQENILNYARARRMQRTFDLAMKIARLHFAKERDSDAMEALNHALSMDSHNPLANYLVARIRVKRGQHHEAIKSLALTQECDPNNPCIKQLMGDCLLALGDEEQALEFYEAALKGYQSMDVKVSSDDYAHFAPGDIAQEHAIHPID